MFSLIVAIGLAPGAFASAVLLNDPLAADDACQGQTAGGSCSLHALQLEGRKAQKTDHSASPNEMRFQLDSVCAGTESCCGRGSPRPADERTLYLRYAVLSRADYSWDTVLRQLRSSVSLMELHLRPAVASTHTVRYVIMVDNRTKDDVGRVLCDLRGLCQWTELINLDLDPDEPERMKCTQPWLSTLDGMNIACVRRMLADAAHMGPGSARLLVGTDVSFLKPDHFLTALNTLKKGQAKYLAAAGFTTLEPDGARKEVLYQLAFNGPRCDGLCGDFVLLGPTVHITVANICDKMAWYQDAGVDKLEPACELCKILSGGLHAIDQFSMSLVLGEATGGACKPFDMEKLPPIAWGRPAAEVCHDKGIRNPNAAGVACTLD